MLGCKLFDFGNIGHGKRLRERERVAVWMTMVGGAAEGVWFWLVGVGVRILEVDDGVFGE